MNKKNIYPMYKWMKDLFPLCRSISGQGSRDTLHYIQKILKNLKIKQVKSGYKAFDWTVPDEWNIKDAYIKDSRGIKLINFKDNNLHVVSYSEPVNKHLTLNELNKHLYSLPSQPNAIPYVTSYYKKRWGFCLTENQRKKLKSDKYHVVINSSLEPGHMSYGELLIPGKTKKEIFISTYICHPSMANNELSGPVLTTALAKYISGFEKHNFSYRIIFIPETIGSIVYLSKNINKLKKNVMAGFNVTCVGDDRAYSFLPSRNGNTLSDRVALHVLKHKIKKFIKYSYLDRGSDERQYCAPGVDLPVASVMRSKYGSYPEYHTSLDNLSFVNQSSLEGSFKIYKCMIDILESNFVPKMKIFCEPQLSLRGIYPDLSIKNSTANLKIMMNILAYVDGKNSLFDIAELLKEPFWKIHKEAIFLQKLKLIK
jgi:aminopeptidase-like protein